jgi:hypothetical protein
MDTAADTYTDEPISFYKIIKDFTCDLIRTFPELKENDYICEGLINILNNNLNSLDATEIYDYCKRVYPEHFFNILYKNESIFSPDASGNTYFLPNINFTQLWSSNISENTKNVIWQYLQLILFSVVPETENMSSFGDTAKLFEAINEDEFTAKIEETFNGFAQMCEDMSGVSQEDIPNREDVENHLKGIFSGKIGSLAKDIAGEVASELDIDAEGVTDMKDVFKKLIKNPQKLMELAKKVGDKLDSKIKSGEIKESELLEEASQYMNNLKDMPGAEGMKDLLSKFGLNNMSNAQTGAMKSEMDKRVKKSKQQERMRAELERRNLEKAKKLLEEQQRATAAAATPVEPEKPQKTKRNKKK